MNQFRAFLNRPHLLFRNSLKNNQKATCFGPTVQIRTFQPLKSHQPLGNSLYRFERTQRNNDLLFPSVSDSHVGWQNSSAAATHPHAGKMTKLTSMGLFGALGLASFAAISQLEMFYGENWAEEKVVPLEPQSELDIHAQSVGYLLNHGDTSEWIQTRSTFDLLRSLAVFAACQSELLVDQAPNLISIAKALNVSDVMFWFIKRTFFHQFCGGENHEEVVPTMRSLQQAGVSAILDLSMESDLDENSMNEQLNHVSLTDARADKVVELIKESIRTASTLNADNFVAVKITALGSTDALLHSSAVLGLLQDAFLHFDDDHDGHITLSQFRNLVSTLPGAPRLSADVQLALESMFNRLDADEDGYIDWIELTDAINMHNENTRHFFVGKIKSPKWCKDRVCSVSSKFQPAFKNADVAELQKISDRIDEVCRYAQLHNVRLMIDAEQTYFQPAIDYLAVNAMKKYNRQTERPCVYNTYQLYLKDGLMRLGYDLERSDRANGKFTFAAKLVRGAYMISERKRASVLNIRSPVQDCIDDTHADYNKAIDILLNRASQTEKSSISFVIASHNWDSVNFACNRMKELGMETDSQVVHFAQLLGMQDHLSFTLSQNGYNVCKYIPYGPVEDVIPYLLRRVQENRSMLKVGDDSSSKSDMSLLWKEIKSRISFGEKDRGQSTGVVPVQ